MKFATKLILGTTIIITILFSLGGAIMIRNNFYVSYENLIQQNTKQHILYRYSLESGIRGSLENNKDFSKDVINEYMKKLVSYGKQSDMVGAIWNNELIYSNIDEALIDKEVESYYKGDHTSYLVKEVGNKIYMYLATNIQVSNKNIILLNIYDITSVFSEREEQNAYYIKWFLVIIFAYVISVIIFTKILTSPIEKLNQISKRIATGNYKERTNIKNSDEIGELSQSFDIMADSIETHIQMLEEDIKKRELFIADFSHELKTPMTSMMGYSKLLMSDDCDKKLQQKYANYIYWECKRLEILSRKLLKLMEIDELPIEMVSVSTEWLKEKTDLMMQPLLENDDIKWINEWEPCFIKGDGQLLLDLLKNLIENGIKASDKELYISIQGKKIGYVYEVSVTDHGCGIEESELDKILNPFYMTDKSRSKIQGSSGLGLSICNKIAGIHNSKLVIISHINKGTRISINLEVENEEDTMY